jgi:activator of 2-hydroxyglutaryl-CoA dehydratase
MLTVGIDIVSITTKIFILDNGKILGTDVTRSGSDMEKAWRDNYQKILIQTGKKEPDIQRIVSTGYGRNIVSSAVSGGILRFRAISASYGVNKCFRRFSSTPDAVTENETSILSISCHNLRYTSSPDQILL